MAEPIVEPVTYSILIHRDEDDGSLWAELPQMPGVFAAGADMDELREALEEAVGFYLSSGDLAVTVKLTDSSVEEPVSKQEMTFVPA